MNNTHKPHNVKLQALNEYLRNYGNLNDSEKPIIVSAILLALNEQKYGFSLDSLKGDSVAGKTDGDILYRYIARGIKRAEIAAEAKLLTQFHIITDKPLLSRRRDDIGKTPLKFLAEYINSEIYSAISLDSSAEDFLGRFYGDFVGYSGDIVLTPKHITELSCDLVGLKHDDVIFDPCCGTGGFLIAGLHRMLQDAGNDAQKRT